MKLNISRSANATSYYVYRSERINGKQVSKKVMNLGTAAEIKAKYGQDIDTDEWARAKVKELREEYKANKKKITSISFVADEEYEDGVKRKYNVGYLAIQKVLYSLGFSKICEEIKKDYKFQYEFEQIVSNLIYSRILSPGSKKSTYNYCKTYLLEDVKYQEHDVYRALDVLHDKSDFIQEQLYKNSTRVIPRNMDVVYYDCTNFYFEIETEDELRKYGCSKENRPNPIVQLGMFMDGNGIPLCHGITPGNTNEQTTLRPLEEKIIKQYKNSNARMIICTDAGLASDANKRFNSIQKRSFIVTQSLKKMDKVNREWALAKGRSLIKEPLQDGENPNIVHRDRMNECWRLVGSNELYSLDDIDTDDISNFNKIFYKEKHIISPQGTEQRLIVSYSLKYKRYMEEKRELHVERAEKKAKQKNGNESLPSDVRKYIDVIHTTDTGEIATHKVYSINQKVIDEEARFDGFYAITTSIESKDKSIEEIIAINRNRWEIEESFFIMKSYLQARPVYVNLESRIRGHFLTCFISLLVFRILEKQVNKISPNPITANSLITELREMQISGSQEDFYIGSFVSNQTTRTIQEFLGMKFNCKYLLPKTVIDYVKKSKKI